MCRKWIAEPERLDELYVFTCPTVPNHLAANLSRLLAQVQSQAEAIALWEARARS